ncbi:MAG TPA: FAD-dependent oxidoreductase, partial [Phycisphaerales bacterium]|nr:FAD-dependent oxidoreductase [Phycisphaerales bacterium]
MRKTCGFVLVCIVWNFAFVQETESTVSAAESSQIYDVVVYGGTSAGVSAAVQAKRMGKTAIIVGPDRHLGGLTAGGLGWTDSGRKEAVGGISREFYQRVKKHYDKAGAWKYQKPEEYSRYRRQDDAMWVFEPHVAEQTFEELVAEYKIPVRRDEWLERKDGVTKAGSRIVSITMLSGKTYRGRIFIDATYEGDLMAGAGVSYHVGREGNDVYGETLNGVQTRNATS